MNDKPIGGQWAEQQKRAQEKQPQGKGQKSVPRQQTQGGSDMHDCAPPKPEKGDKDNPAAEAEKSRSAEAKQ